MPETFEQMVDRVLRDHEGYTGDGAGGNGALPVGDRSSAAKPISKRDMRTLLKAPVSFAMRAEKGAEDAEAVVGGLGTLQSAVNQAAAEKAAAEAARIAAQAAADASIQAGQWDQEVADAAARLALAGLAANWQVYQLDTEHVWRWDGSAWVDRGESPLALKANAAPDQIKPEWLDDVFGPGTNLVNPVLIRRGKRYSPAASEIVSDTAWRCTGFIPVEPGKNYALSGTQTSPAMTAAWFTAASDTGGGAVQISPVSIPVSGLVLTAPVGANYLVLNLTNSGQDVTTYDSSVQVTQSDTVLPYQPWRSVVKPDRLPDFEPAGAADALRADLVTQVSHNLIDPAACDYTRRYSVVTLGYTSDTLGIAASAKIPVKSGEFYIVSGPALYTQSGVPQGGFFSSEGATTAASNIVFGSPPTGAGHIFQVPEGITHVVLNLWKLDRLVASTSLDGEVQMEVGEVATPYQPYNPVEQIRPELIPSGSGGGGGGGGGSAGLDAAAWYKFVEADGGGSDLSHKLPRFREKWLKRSADLVVVNSGTSLTARSAEHCSDHPQARLRPPLMHSNNFASHIWDRLAWEGQQYRRYDVPGFFAETGAWATASNLPEWDDNTYRQGLTRYSSTADAAVAFTIPAGAWAARFIYRTDSLGCDAALSVSGGLGKVEAYDETAEAWVEAHGFTFSQAEAAPVARSIVVPTSVSGATATQSLTSKGNTTYQKRLKLRVVDRANPQTITVSRTGGGARMMYWGVEWSPREHMVTYVNAARGSHNTGVTSTGLTRYQDNEVWSFKPDLILSENPIHNDGAASVSSVYAEGYWGWLTERFFFREDFELSMVGSCARLGIPVPEFAIFTSSIAWNFGGIEDDGSLKFGMSSESVVGPAKALTALDKFSEAHLHIVDEHPDAVSIHAAQRWCDAAVAIHGNMKTATEGSGKGGLTFTNEGSHWNDTGSRVMAKAVLPVIPRIW